jgi:hypothetical protein
MKALSRADKIGVVVHGPEVIDSGSAQKVLSYLEKFGDITAVLGGTMGRLAIIDADLGDTIMISPRRRPSQSIKELHPNSDIIVILNQAKTRETGLTFGIKVAANAGATRPIIHIDCGGRFIAVFYGSRETKETALVMAKDLGLDYLGPSLPEERDLGTGNIVQDGDILKRRLTGVRPGELISINGTVVAKATDLDVPVEIWAKNGRVINIKGAEPKRHGLEKLSNVTLEDAIIRSGNIRRTNAQPKELECRGNGAALIDHSAEEAFEMAEGTCIAVTVGDDTTAIAGDILSRLGIPVIGIVDGDLDGLSQRTIMPKGSVVVKVEPGYDDLVGKRVREEVFHNKNMTNIKASELEERVLEIAGERVIFVERL